VSKNAQGGLKIRNCRRTFCPVIVDAVIGSSWFSQQFYQENKLKPEFENWNDNPRNRLLSNRWWWPRTVFCWLQRYAKWKIYQPPIRQQPTTYWFTPSHWRLLQSHTNLSNCEKLKKMWYVKHVKHQVAGDKPEANLNIGFLN